MIVRSDTPRCGFVFSLSRHRRELDHSAIHDCCIGQSFELVTLHRMTLKDAIAFRNSMGGLYH
ncbi:hypothetical protein OUZ56_000519 [Daphnia magna]|uniref:Uncharacterized protein n=1 Tax=Daphnia magna TaxID=35525 RepID=A0ABQ9ZZX4_9CRUS|nr:hypothetical protein OUZ56_000519 [Daphnia magna]